jgi:hypothetical protein
MKKHIALIMLAFAGLTAFGAESLRFAEDFADGNLTDNTVWRSKKGSQPWTASDNRVRPSGTIIFDSLSTSDFKPIESGAFTLRFTVTFNSAEKTGNNRFSVMLRDSTTGGAGYAATIAQGTSNNCSLETIAKGKQTMIAKMAAKNAVTFEPGKAADVVFSRSADGTLSLTVDGTVRMKAVNRDFTRFDSVQFTERCKQADMIQALGEISLYANEP